MISHAQSLANFARPSQLCDLTDNFETYMTLVDDIVERFREKIGVGESATLDIVSRKSRLLEALTKLSRGSWSRGSWRLPMLFWSLSSEMSFH